MSQPIDINEDFMDLKSFAKRPIFMRQVSADMLSLISYKTAKNNQLIKQSSKYFKELNVSSLMKGSNGSLNKQGWVTDIDPELMVAGASFKIVSEYIKAENLLGLKAFLDARHVNLEDRDEDGQTPLIYAASLGRLGFIPLLLRCGADLNAEDNEKATALHWAAREGHADVCLELIEQGSVIEAQDCGQWTPLLWACYGGHAAAADCLISRGANINARGVYQVSCLVWAAGRGHFDIVQLLIDKNIKVDIGDKYGTTALIWACRKGHEDIVELLLRSGSSVDAVGMYSWTPLLVAAQGNYISVVEKLLERSPNVNTVDKDGLTALAIACKEGYFEIASMLLAAGAHTNLQDRFGETNLIYACKGGHKNIVEALIKKYADVDIRGKDGRTCLHWAIDKNQASIVRMLLETNPDLEAKTLEGDTPLLRAVRQRNTHMVEMLLDKRAKITAADNKGDTALHVAMRARSKGIVEILLRNPKHSQLLYKPNRQGETPYNIDAASPKTILGQIFGARKINAFNDGETIMGYDLYSSALADILTEPSLTMPITVGLYAKWGSGKSFLLGKLKNEMISFTQEWIIEPAFNNSILLFLAILHLASITGLIGWIVPYSTFNLYDNSVFIGLGISLFIFGISYAFLIILWKGTLYYDFYSLYKVKMFLAINFQTLKLVLDVIFSHPPGPEFLDGRNDSAINQRATPLKLLFTDKTKVVTASGGQNSVTQMLGSLFEAVEEQYGSCATRLYRAFKPKPLNQDSNATWRRLCCIPYVLIYLTCFICVVACIILVAITLEYSANLNLSANNLVEPLGISKFQNATANTFFTGLTVSEEVVFGLLIILSVLVGATLLANIYTIGNCIVSLAFSQRKHLQRSMSKLDVVKSEGYLQALKGEVQLLIDMVACLDAFSGQRTRLVVIVDGLDSCEQSKVLSVLDAVHMLFSDEGSPFIILLAIDPHVITKAIELNIHHVYRETSISGDAYLRNLVHMPFFLQNVSLRRVNVAQQISGISFGLSKKSSSLWLETDDRRMSTESSSAARKKGGGGKHSKSVSRRTRYDSVSSSVGSRLNQAGTSSFSGVGDSGLVSLNDDYFSDVNVKSVRRFMNVIYVIGRLMKAFNIDFSWYHLAVWVNMTEQWPYRISWLIFFFEMNEDSLEDSTALKDLYEKVQCVMPTQKELEPLLEMDRDEKKLDALLSLKKKMTVKDLKTFLPFSINLDPYIKKVIKDEYQMSEENGKNYRGHAGMLSSRQVAGLRKISGHELNVSPGSHHVASFSPYGYGMGIPIPTWPNYHMTQQSNMFENAVRNASTRGVVELTSEMTKKQLSKKSIEEVCHVVRTIEGISNSQVETYCETITHQNISGAVLAHCSIGELKPILNMNFGDWELFQIVIYELRELERKQKSEQKMKSLHLQGSRRSFQPSSPERKRRVGVLAEGPSSAQNPPPNIPNPKSSTGSNSGKLLSTHETQVTFEDAMISGLLSTLNEEAQEDVLNDKFDHEVSESCENVSVTQSLESIQKNFNPQLLFSSAPQTRHSSLGSRDIEKGYQSSAPLKSASIVLSGIGGEALGSHASWDFGSQTDNGMLNIPTSPTLHSRSSSTHQKSSLKERSEPDKKRKPRHLRDRLSSLCEDDRTRRTIVLGSGQTITVEEHTDEPYAWISQTAPASPRYLRSREGSIVPEDESQFLEEDLVNIRHKRLQLQSNLSAFNSKESILSAADQGAISVEKLTEKVKKKLRHALLAMDHHHSGMPAIHRAKTSKGIQRSHLQVPDQDPNLNLNTSISSQSLNPDPPQFSGAPEKEEDVLDELESVCSSPEQETVTRRPESSTRGPPIQQIFSRGNENPENR